MSGDSIMGSGGKHLTNGSYRYGVKFPTNQPPAPTFETTEEAA